MRIRTKASIIGLGFMLTTGLVSAASTFPDSYLFRPILAGNNEPISYISINNVRGESQNFSGAFISLGEQWPLIRWETSNTGAVQIGVYSAIQSQFNLDARSDDLLNTDFVVGLPLSYRQGKWSVRSRLFHQSSHLGDVLLLTDNPPERINLSFEALDLLVGYDFEETRVYAGGTWIVGDNPETGLASGESAYRAGVEYRGSEPLILGGRPILGLDFFAAEAFDNDVQTKFVAGLGFGSAEGRSDKARLLFQAFDGPVPFGQFFDRDAEYYGVVVSFALN